MCRDIDQLLDRKDLDGFVVAVSIDNLYKISKKLLENGFNVFIEKPVAENLDQVNELRYLAEKRGVVAVPGFVLRFDPLTKYFREMILGENRKPFYVMIQRSGRRAPRYRRFSILLDLGIHDIDLIHYLFGEEVKLIDARITRVLDDESYNIYLDYRDGVAHLVSDPIPLVKIRKIYMNFDDKILYEGDYVASEVIAHGTGGERVISKIQRSIEPLALEIKAFVDKISGREAETPTLRDAVNAHRIISVIIK